MTMKLEARVGNTTYTLDAETDPRFAVFTRVNSDGETIFRVPHELLAKHVKERLIDVVRGLVEDGLARYIERGR